MSFFDLGPRLLYTWKLKLDFLRNYWAVLNQILCVSFQIQGNETLMHDAGQMAMLAATPI